VNPRSPIFGAVTLALALVSTTAWGQKKPDDASAPDESESAATDDQRAPAPENPETDDPEAGGGASTKFEFIPYGLGQGQVTYDSTQSFQHGQGNNSIRRSGAPTLSQAAQGYAGQHGRLTMTARNTILGFRVKTPTWHSLTTSARFEGDFEGAPASTPPDGSESGFLTGGPFRMRQAYVLLETPVVDLLVGQTQQLFGWGPLFYPHTVNNLGIPGMAFGREFQIKLSHVFGSSAFDFEVAAGAFRPAQRDSERPDVQGGIRLAIKGWQGIQNGKRLVPMQIAAVGTYRWFKVQGLNPVTTNAIEPRADRAYTTTGAGFSIDAIIPIIPASSADDPGNSLTLVGEFTRGSAISDLYQSLSFGLPQQPVSNAVATSSTNVDPGIVVFDQPLDAVGNLLNGTLRPVNVQSFLLNLQYTLPGADMVSISGIYSFLSSDNVDKVANPLEVQPGTFSRIFLKQQYIEGALHIYVTPPLRFSFGYANTLQTFVDGAQETNHRGVFKSSYAF
jgi:hypothetical protein